MTGKEWAQFIKVTLLDMVGGLAAYRDFIAASATVTVALRFSSIPWKWPPPSRISCTTRLSEDTC